MFRIRKYGLFIVFGMIIMIGAIFLNRENDKELEVSSIPEERDPLAGDEPEENDEERSAEEPIEIAVDVKGAVLNPGVYHVEESARVYDAIEQAGGFLKEAEEKQINLAERIKDEMFVYVPEEGETDTPNLAVVQTASENANSDDKDMVHINNASLAELEELNGVGPSKAQAILDHIEENGPFSDVEDLLDVGGIGEKTLDHFKEQIIVP